MSSLQSFHMEVEVPVEARGLVIGKGGRTIKSFRESPGISSARLLPSGEFQIRGDSNEAVQRIVTSVQHLISGTVMSKFSRHFPEFHRICFCKTVEKPLLAVDKVSFEKFTGDTSFVSVDNNFGKGVFASRYKRFWLTDQLKRDNRNLQENRWRQGENQKVKQSQSEQSQSQQVRYKREDQKNEVQKLQISDQFKNTGEKQQNRTTSRKQEEANTRNLNNTSIITEYGTQYFCFKRGEAITSASASFSDNDNLAAAFSRKMEFSEYTKFLPNWDFTAYKSELLSCFKFLRLEEEDVLRNLKMIVGFGKEIFHGRAHGQLVDGGFVSLPYLHQLFNQNLLKHGFSTASSDKAVTDLRLHLERLHYVKVSFRTKISIHVADREQKPLQNFNVSVRCVGKEGFVHNSEVQCILCSKDYFQVLGVDIEASTHEVQKAYRRCLLKIEFHAGNLAAAEKARKLAREASDCLMDALQRERHSKKFYSASKSNPCVASPLSPEKAEISRVRREPRKHCIVTFCREGRDTTDFRLAVTSHGREVEIQEDMVKWVDAAWRNRTPDQLLVFLPASRYEIRNIRYKEAETYVTEDFKFRIENVREKRGSEREKQRWECALSSRRSKWSDGMNDDMVSNDVVALVKEAVKFSQLLDHN